MIFGLRSRLVLIVLAAALPTLVLAWLAAGRERTRERLDIELDAINLAREIAREERDLIERGRLVLQGLAALPAVRAQNERCDGVLRRAVELYPGFLNFGVIDPSGRVSCSAVPFEPDVNLADRDYFRGALATGELTLGMYQVGRITGRPSINLGLPLTGQDAEPGVVFAAIDVTDISALAADLLPPSVEMIEFDGAGRVLSTFPPDVQPAGTVIDEFDVLQPAIAAADTGLIDLPGGDGPVRVMAFARIRDDIRGSDVYVGIRLSRAALYAHVSREMRRTLVALSVVTLLALLFTRWLAGRLVLRPVDRLLAATRGIAAGDLSARIGPPYPGGELGGLGRAFDEAAGTLAAQQAERDRVLSALRNSESSYQSLVDNAPYGILTADLEGRFVRVNPALVQILGARSAADLIGVETRRFFADPDARDALVARLYQNGRIREVEFNAVKADGTPILIRAGGRVVRNDAGEPVGTEWFAEDVTEKRDLEHRLLHAQKMEAIGRLAGGVAHDFNNLLTVILGYGSTLRERLEDPVARAEIDEVRRAAERAQSLTSQLLAFSRKQLLAPRTLDLNEAVAGARRMLERIIGEQIEIDVALADGAVCVQADPSQVEQVILNLAVNARDAMPRGGRLHIGTNVRTLDGSAKQLPAGEYAVLTVEDTGIGMDAKMLQHIFEPFFTTKDLGRGTGLGLSTVYGVVQQSGGTILVHSRPGRGTRFEVLFPRVPAADPVSDMAEERPASGGRGETILLVEDDPAVRALVRRLLAARGYRVLPAGSGREAIELAESFSGAIDLLLTDVVLPDLTPQEIRAGLAGTRPGIPAILMSGYATDVLMRHGGVPEDAEFIAKPFEPSELLGLIRRSLGRATV